MNRREFFQMGAGAAALSVTGFPAFAENSNVVRLTYSGMSQAYFQTNPESNSIGFAKFLCHRLPQIRRDNPGKKIHWVHDMVTVSPYSQVQEPPIVATYAADFVDVLQRDGSYKRVKDRYATA